MVDPYAMLGLLPGAGDAAIHAAYRRLARAHHPDVDRRQDAAAQMREINVAYEVLRDPARRAAYDASTAAAPPLAPSLAATGQAATTALSAAAPGAPLGAAGWRLRSGSPAPAMSWRRPAWAIAGQASPSVAAAAAVDRQRPVPAGVVLGLTSLVALLAAWALVAVLITGPGRSTQVRRSESGIGSRTGAPGASTATTEQSAGRAAAMASANAVAASANASTNASGSRSGARGTAVLPNSSTGAPGAPANQTMLGGAAGTADVSVAAGAAGMGTEAIAAASTFPSPAAIVPPEPALAGSAALAALDESASTAPVSALRVVEAPRIPPIGNRVVPSLPVVPSSSASASAAPQLHIQAVGAQPPAAATPVAPAAAARSLASYDRAWTNYATALRVAGAGSIARPGGPADRSGAAGFSGGAAGLLTLDAQLGISRGLYLDARTSWYRQAGTTLAAPGTSATTRPDGEKATRADLRLRQAAEAIAQAQAAGKPAPAAQVRALLDEAEHLHRQSIAEWVTFLAEVAL